MSRLYSAICENLLLPLADTATGRSIHRKLRFLEKAQYWSRDRLLDYQNKQLRRVAEFAYREVPYYRRIFHAAGLTPRDIQTTADLLQLPLLTKQIIRSEGVDGMVSGDPGRLTHIRTSGSSGIQGEAYLSKEAQSMTLASELLFFKWGGFRLGHKHLQTGITPERGFEKSIKDLLFRTYYVSAFNLSDPQLRRVCQLLHRKRIRILIGYASSLYCIARHILPESVPLDSVISLGDTLFDHYRTAVEKAFCCAVTDTYGCSEGFQIAGQCEYQNYHICMPLNYVEILDPDDRPVKDGELGRVVLTRLDLNPMPFLRYEVGDLAVLSTEARCECGRSLRMLESVRGRDTDIVTTPTGHRLIVHFFTGIMEHEQSVEQYQVRQEKMDEICLRIVPQDGFGREAMGRIRKRILDECHGDLRVEFDTVETIEASPSGKRRFVVSRFKY